MITGAGAGTGAEAARQLARECWTICATDINPTALATLREELSEDRHCPETSHLTCQDACF